MIKDTNDKHTYVGCHRRRPGARLDLIKIKNTGIRCRLDKNIISWSQTSSTEISILLNYEGICWYLLTRVFMFLWLGLVKSRKTDIKYVAGQ